MASKKAKRLEALKRSQEINQLLEDSTIEGEALLNSAGESRPSYESHVLDLLEKPGMNPPEETRQKRRKMSRSKPKSSKSKRRR
jgi:hypothetical protein